MKTVICGLWHVHAEGYYRTAAKYGEIVGVYEPNEAWRKEFCAKYGLKELRTLDEVKASGAEGAIVCTSTDTHTPVILALAEAGIDIFTEKVLALTSAECEQIADAIKKAGVRFVISFVHKANGGIRALKKIAEGGELGKLNYLRFRNVHSGSSNNWLPPHFYSAKECGGGAMIDLGAHGMYIAEWFLGMPIAAKSVFTLSCSNPETAKKNVDGVEDNAVTVLQYENGAIAVNETGFVSSGYPMSLEIGGEKGRALWVDTTCEKCVDGKLEPVPFEPTLESPLDRFMKGEIVPECGIDEAIALTKLMEMAYRQD